MDVYNAVAVITTFIGGFLSGIVVVLVFFISWVSYMIKKFIKGTDITIKK